MLKSSNDVIRSWEQGWPKEEKPTSDSCAASSFLKFLRGSALEYIRDLLHIEQEVVGEEPHENVQKEIYTLQVNFDWWVLLCA